MDIKISQSMIKAFDKDGYCPMKLKVAYVYKTHRLIPSDAMTKGIYFETLCLGSGVGGSTVNDLPRKRNGEKRVAQERIEMQAQDFPEILKAHRMEVLEKDVYLEHELEKGIWICGTTDFTSPIWDDTDGPIPKSIVDLKLTQNIYSQFGPFCWHFPHNMDHTQAFMYTHLWRECRGEDLPFYYMVFDYKPTPEYKMVKKLVGTLEMYELQESIRKTLEKINHHEGRGYYTNANAENCKNCPLQATCPDVTKAKKIQTV
jgi:hypothetical protein